MTDAAYEQVKAYARHVNGADPMGQAAPSVHCDHNHIDAPRIDTTRQLVVLSRADYRDLHERMTREPRALQLVGYTP